MFRLRWLFSLSLHIFLQFAENIVTWNSSKITWVGGGNLRIITCGPLTTIRSGYPLHILRKCFVIVTFVVVSGRCYGLQLSASKYWSNLSLIHRQLDIIEVFNWNYLAIGTFSIEVYVDLATSVHEDTISQEWWARNLSYFVHCFMCVCVCVWLGGCWCQWSLIIQQYETRQSQSVCAYPLGYTLLYYLKSGAPFTNVDYH